MLILRNHKTSCFLHLILLALIVFFGTQFTPKTALGADSALEAPEWLSMFSALLGGLALFLFGMRQMADGLKAVAGEQLKTILAKVTANRLMGAATGAFVTALIQSSSITTVLVVGFISAGLMSSAQSISIIMGANIGTTITAQILAFNVTELALPMIGFGFALQFLGRREKVRHIGSVTMGLGLIFLGMTLMGQAMAPLRSYDLFLDVMAAIDAPVLGIVVGALFTALIQSSSATTGIVIVLASQGLISLPGGIAMAIGANIGTCVTALLATLGRPRDALRAATVHVLFNVVGALLWVFLIDYLAAFAIWISPTTADLSGIERLAAETPRQIANANTIFNVINTLLFLPLTIQIARLVDRLIPDKSVEAVTIIEPRYLDRALIATPSLALDRVRLELGRMGDRVKIMLATMPPAMLERDGARLGDVHKLDDEVDILRDRIIEYLGLVGRQPLTDHQSRDLVKAMTAADDFERMGDLIETDLVETATQIIEQNLQPSETTKVILAEFYEATTRAVDAAILAIETDDQRAARDVIAAKDHINRLMSAALRHQATRISADAPDRLAHHIVETSIIDKLKKIYALAKHLARLNLPEREAETGRAEAS